MREILFRGKDAFGEWQYGSFSREVVEQVCGEENVSCGWIRQFNFTTKSMVSSKVERETVSEFTGLYDKNGKRIFEGDIVEYENEIGLQRDIVVWTLDEYNKVAGFGLEYHVFYTITKKDQDKFEVIGNKWDNPELLGKCRT